MTPYLFVNFVTKLCLKSVFFKVTLWKSFVLNGKYYTECISIQINLRVMCKTNHAYIWKPFDRLEKQAFNWIKIQLNDTVFYLRNIFKYCNCRLDF